MDCAPQSRFAELVRGEVKGDEATALREHASTCETCAPRLAHAEAAQADAPTGELPTGSLGLPKAKELELPRGTQVGRYVVVDMVGQGGMGLVYAAYDPELDRRVALKLLKAPLAGRSGRNTAAEVSEEGRSRLMREAQAMARLAHPNVVAVFDAGVHQGRIYVAMEFVAGTTLKEWLKSHKRPWRDLVRVFAEAGRGLAAAHAAHLVHRDFKPANVLIGADGRVRVTDFGLARAEGSEVIPPSAPPSLDSGSHSLAEPITQLGSVVGTVGYMAPEQIRSQSLDPRTDQFAFCVCLWEALYGKRPFTGESAASITQQVLEGRLPEVPRGGVPARLHALLLKGLSTDPAQRFASMDALLVELQRDPAEALRHAAPWLVAGAVLAVFAAGFAWRQSRAVSECARYSVASAWDDAVKAKVKAAFDATQKPFAAAAFDSSVRALDAHAAAYLSGRQASCEATKVQRSQSEEVLALRERCYERRLDELKAVTSVLSEADVATVERSVTVVYGLTPPVACEDVPALRASQGKESDENAEARALRETVLRGKALIDAGQYAKAQGMLEPAVKELEGKRPGLHAQAQLWLGYLLQQTGKFPDALARMQRAFNLALAAGLDEIAARSAILAGMVTGLLERPAESRLWLDVSKALLERMGGDARLEVEHLRAQGIVLATSGRSGEAAMVHEQTLAAATRVYGTENPLLWRAWFDVGTSYVGAHEWIKAVPALERALDIKQKSQGPDHPEVALALANLGTSYFFSGQAKKSREAFERALDIRERTLGKESPRLVPLLNNLGDTLAKAGELEPARLHLERAIALGDKTLGPTHAYTVASRLSLAEAELTAGRMGESAALLEQVLAVKPPAAYLTEVLAVKATLQLREGKAKEARGLAEQAVVSAESIGKAAAELILPLTALGEALLALKLHREAVPVLERALKVAEDTRAWAVQKADVQFPLARALLATGGDAPRALGLAAEAEGAWSTTAARSAELKTLQAWKQSTR